MRHQQRRWKRKLLASLALTFSRHGPVDAFQTLTAPGPIQRLFRPRGKRSKRRFLSPSKPGYLYSTTSSSTTPPLSDQIDGLLSPILFDRFSSLHDALGELRKQIPVLLSVPLVESEAAKVYAVDTRLIVGAETDSIELASDRAELLSLNNVFVMTVTASTRAGAFLSSFGQQSKPQKDPTVDCRIIVHLDSSNNLAMGNEPIRLKVLWEANILPAPSSETIQGVSILTLHSETCRVVLHRLASVSWNGVVLDPAAIGQSLAVLRQTAKSLQDAPLLQPLIATASNAPLVSSSLNIFNQVRERFVKQQATSSTERSAELAPLFVSTYQNGIDTGGATNATSAMDVESLYTPIDKFIHDSDIPLPGSTAWVDYAVCHRLATHFVTKVVPILSSDNPIADKTLFRPEARILTLDGSLLLQGAKSVSNFYKSLATVRRRMSGGWVLLRASLKEWKTVVSNTDGREPGYAIKMEIEYRTSLNVPGMAPTTVRGTDLYSITMPLTPEINIEALVIDEIQQKQVSIRENSNPSDGILFMRSLASAVETTGLLPSTDGFWLDLLKRATSDVRQGNNDKQASVQERIQLPPRTDNVALTAYRVMEALHRDWANFDLSNTDSMPRSSKAPANQFLTDNVQLNGLLGETLIRGRAQYNQIFTLSSAALQSALATGSVVNGNVPVVKIELTPKGNVACYVTFDFKLSPPSLSGIPGLVKTKPATREGPTVPLKIFIASEYNLCPFSGLILQHRLLETRVNGQLTAGDVLSKWIQRLAGNLSNDKDARDETAADWMRSLLATMDLVRSINSNTPNK